MHESPATWLGMVAGAAMSLFMVHAMMEFTAALLAEFGDQRRPQDLAELRRRLLALNESGRGYRVVADSDRTFHLEWDVVDAEWARQFSRVKLTTIYQAQLLADAHKNELRYRELIRTGSLFYGMEGTRPRFSATPSFFSGPMELVWSGLAVGLSAGWPPRIADVVPFEVDTRIAKNDVRAVLRSAGWSMRPAFWGFQVSEYVQRKLDRLLPDAIQRVPALRLWGVVYPASFAAAVATIVLSVGMDGFGSREWAIVLMVCASWWGVWGVLARLVTARPRRAVRR